MSTAVLRFTAILRSVAAVGDPIAAQHLKQSSSGGAALPSTSKLLHGASVLRPPVKSSGIRVAAVRPNESSNLGVDANTIEQREVLKRSKQLAEENRAEVDNLRRAIVERDT
jgi:L-fucose isomerase-like protein